MSRRGGRAGAGGSGAARPHAGAPSERQLRVAEEIRHRLAAIFARADFRDPALARSHLTVTEVRVGPDLRHATVFMSALGGDPAPLLPALERVSPYLRRQLAAELPLRIAPALAFRVDEAPDRAADLDRLLRSPAVARDL